jgi:ribonuclease-3 family protein
MEKSLDAYFTEVLDVNYTDPREYSPLSLAYIGDSVFDLIVKTIVVSRDNKQAYKYHKEVSQLVKAEAQAGYITKLLEQELLTEEEEWIYKRGRNTKTHSTAKNATVGQYRMATGFECLVGFLYLDKQYDRLFELTRTVLDGDLYAG